MVSDDGGLLLIVLAERGEGPMPKWHQSLLFHGRAGLLVGSLSLVIILSQNAISRGELLRQERIASGLDQQMAYVPAGSFLMGSNSGKSDEAPQHPVYLDGYLMDRYEITNLQYQRFIDQTGTHPPRYWKNGKFPEGRALYPVVGISWINARDYCAWAGKRLPTEAEWEKACRGETGRIYPWGKVFDPQLGNLGCLPGGPQPEMWELAWILLDAEDAEDGPKLLPIGSFPAGASPYGIQDLVGNASEWVADHYNWDGYWEIPDENPLVQDPPWNHVVRGSAWFMPYGLQPGGVSASRCSSRMSSHGNSQDARIGFRCARSISN